MSKPRKNKKENPSLDPVAMRVMPERRFAGIGGDRTSAELRSLELVYEAMEIGVSKRYFGLLHQALKLDRDNVYALLMVATSGEFPAKTRMEIFQHVVNIAAERLGKQAFKEYAPNFWCFIETRAYMLAREYLARELHAAGRLKEAIKEYREMLVLNENDEQGMRYILLPSYLALGRLEEARALMQHYKDVNIIFPWSRVLERLLSGDEPGALKALDEARKQNPHMEAYLMGTRKLPRNCPSAYTPGSQEEAQCHATILQTAWTSHPEAEAWLSRQVMKP